MFAPTPCIVEPSQTTIEPRGMTAWVERSGASGPVGLPQRWLPAPDAAAQNSAASCLSASKTIVERTGDDVSRLRRVKTPFQKSKRCEQRSGRTRTPFSAVKSERAHIVAISTSMFPKLCGKVPPSRCSACAFWPGPTSMIWQRERC